MYRHARMMGWMLGLLALASLACSTSQVPLISRPEPTNTPRPTRTSRPTFTPTPTDTPTPVNTPTPTRTNTPVATATFTPVPPTATFTPAPPTATFTRRPPTATFTPAPPAPPTNTPAPSFAFRLTDGPRGYPNCTAPMGVFGNVYDRNGGRMNGIGVQVYIPGGSKLPGEDAYSGNAIRDDRNFEVLIWNPGDFEVVLSDGTHEISPRVRVRVDSFMDPNCEPRQGGSQWVKLEFRQN